MLKLRAEGHDDEDRQSAAYDFAKRRVMAALDRSLDRKAITDDGETKSETGAAMWW